MMRWRLNACRHVLTVKLYHFTRPQFHLNEILDSRFDVAPRWRLSFTQSCVLLHDRMLEDPVKAKLLLTQFISFMGKQYSLFQRLHRWLFLHLVPSASASLQHGDPRDCSFVEIPEDEMLPDICDLPPTVPVKLNKHDRKAAVLHDTYDFDVFYYLQLINTR